MVSPNNERFTSAYAELLSRAPENHMEPRLAPVQRLVEVLGSPHLAYPVIHITGTNGKTSTARLIEGLLREHNLRTGRFTSPHLVSVTERISIDGEPISEDTFADTWEDIRTQVAIVDGELHQAGAAPLTYFEILACLGFAAFAEAPVDVAIVEVGLGGSWDATNVVRPDVAVVTPISLDHQDMLGDTIAAIATEKSGIIKPECVVVSSRQPDDAAAVLAERAREVGVQLAWEGQDFAVGERALAVGGQVLTVQGIAAIYDGVYLPVHGEHQAHNAVTAVAAVEMFLGRGKKALAGDVLEAGFAGFATPGRLEVVRPSPVMVIDAAHNPAGIETMLKGLEEAFNFDYTVAVFGVLGDKDAEAMLGLLEPVVDEIVVTQSNSPRAVPADELAELAREVFGDEDRVHTQPRLDDAIVLGSDLAEAGGESRGGVVCTGSVTVAGEVRLLTVKGTK